MKYALAGLESALSDPKFALSLSGLKSVLAGLQSVLSALKSALPDRESRFQAWEDRFQAWEGLGEQTKDGRTKVPLFYMTLFPSGPLPRFLSLQLKIMQSRATGITEHILPLGNLLISGLFAPFLVLGGRNGKEKMNKNTFCPAWLKTLKIKNLGKMDLWS